MFPELTRDDVFRLGPVRAQRSHEREGRGIRGLNPRALEDFSRPGDIRGLQLQASRAVTAINAAFATDEQLTAKRAALAAIAAVAEPKERQARYAALYAAESAETKRLLDSGEMEKRMAQLDSDKKKLIGQALLNFAIGSLQAIELGKHGQVLVQQAGISPVELVRILPEKDAIPLLGKVAVDASGFVGGVMKLARAANISVPDARSGSAPVSLNSSSR